MNRIRIRSFILALLTCASLARAGERMTSETNDAPRSVVGGAGGLDGAESANYRLDAAFGEELGGSTAATSANRLAPGFVQMFAFPGTVTDLTALADVSVSSVALQWSTPGLDGAQGALAAGSSYYIRVASYTVPDTFSRFDLANVVFSTAGTLPGALVSTSAVGLQPNTTYWTRLWTKDPGAGLSYASEISTFVTLALPAAIQSVSFVNVYFSSVAVQWVARPSLSQDVSSMTAEGYVVEASTTNFGALIPGGVTSSSATPNVRLSTLTVSDPDLIVDKTYYFRVGTLNWAGIPNYTILGTTDTKFQVNLPVAGDPPYTDLSTGSITANWDRNGNPGNTRYHAEVSKTFDFSGIVTTTDTYNLFYSTGGLDVDTTYYFRVYATTRSVSSAFASLGSTMTWTFAPGIAATPLAQVDVSSLTVRWLNNGNPAGISTYSIVAATAPAYPNPDGGNIVMLSTKPAGSSPAATLSGLEPNTTYFLFGAGVNAVGAQGEYVLLGSTATRPAPPAAVGFEEVSFSSAVASWSTNGNPLGVTTFTAVLSTVAAYPPGGAWDVSLSTVPDAAVVMLTMDGLRLNATYQLFVTAVGHAHTSFASGASSATQASAPDHSPDVADYEPTATTGFTLNWSSGAETPGYDAAPGTTYYADISANPSFSPVLSSSRTFNLSAPFSGLSINTTYYARVAAYSHHHGTPLYTDFGSTATLTAVPSAAGTTFRNVAFTSMTVSWLANGNPTSITTYTVVLSPQTPYPNSDQGNVTLSTAPAGATPTATLSGLDSATTYYLFIAAVNHRGVESVYAAFGSTMTRFSPKTWTGATNNLWNTATNWSPSGVPTKTDAVTIAITTNVSAIGAQISFSSLTLGSPANPVVALTISTTIANGGDVLIYKNSGLTQATTRQLVIAGNFTMVSGSSLSHTSESAVSISSINLRVTGTFELQAGATISVVGRGYRGGPVDTVGFGPGGGGFNAANGKGGGGAGYGGAGGAGAIATAGAGGPTYGSASAPINMGSGGGGAGNTGVGGSGGGVVVIDAATMILDGVILSSGNVGQSVTTANPAAGGGGSGGGVFLAAGDFTGSGTIDVSGGAGGSDTNGGGNGGGGGGGRASVVISGSGVTCGLTFVTTGGAAGGAGAGAGNAGTINTADSLVAAQSFAGTAQSATSVLWNWSLTSGATDYQIFSSTGGPMSPPLGAAASYTTTGLAVNTTASFYVQARACGANLADSPADDESTLALTPAQPSGAVFAEVNMSSMSLSWAANGNPVGVTSYTVVLTTEPAFPNSDSGNVLLSTFAGGAGLSASPFGLDPNTTYYAFVAAKNHAGLLTAYLDLSTAAATLALPPNEGASEFLSIQSGTVTVAWAAFPPSPPAGPAGTSEGYVLEASSNNFGALAPPGAPVFSSATFNVLNSTLSVGAAGAGLDLSNTYYFRVGSLNHQGRANYTDLARLNFQIRQSTDSLSLGQMGLVNGVIVLSTVSTSSMVVTNVGNWPATIALAASTATLPSSPWSLATVPGDDVAALMGVWRAGEPGPPPSEFTTYITTTPTPSQASGNYSSPSQNGYQLAPGDSVTLWFRFFMPTSTSSLAERLKVTPTAVYP